MFDFLLLDKVCHSYVNTRDPDLVDGIPGHDNGVGT